LKIDEKMLIIGLGLIGRQRLDACLKFGIKPNDIYAFDPNLTQLSFVNEPAYDDIRFVNNLGAFSNIKFERAIVAVPHDTATALVVALLDDGTKVLLEKPLGRNIQEAQALASHPHSNNLSIGFNYRFMPGVIALKKALDGQVLGKISTLKMELGHGGGPKDKGSWKLDPVRAGGGVVLDPGIHLIDLLVYLFKATEKNTSVMGKTEWKGFWNTGIEESSLFIGYVDGTPFSISSSIVAWRTRFKVEVIGTERYFEIDGRGRSDGPQTITEGPQWGWLSSTSQKSSEQFSELGVKDNSLVDETFAWLDGSYAVCNIDQALQGMKIYAQVIKPQNEH
jgi:predicted dehydrogenase